MQLNFDDRNRTLKLDSYTRMPVALSTRKRSQFDC